MAAVVGMVGVGLVLAGPAGATQVPPNGDTFQRARYSLQSLVNDLAEKLRKPGITNEEAHDIILQMRSVGSTWEQTKCKAVFSGIVMEGRPFDNLESIEVTDLGPTNTPAPVVTTPTSRMPVRVSRLPMIIRSRITPRARRARKTRSAARGARSTSYSSRFTPASPDDPPIRFSGKTPVVTLSPHTYTP
jgi:hypothetical protein